MIKASPEYFQKLNLLSYSQKLSLWMYLMGKKHIRQLDQKQVDAFMEILDYRVLVQCPTYVPREYFEDVRAVLYGNTT